MKRLWTADLHLGHPAIIKYCNRPFKDVHDMNSKLTKFANERIHEEDSVVHVGDFCTRGVAKGVEGLRLKYSDYIKDFRGNWTLIEGNHDSQNKTKTLARSMFVQISGFNVFVSHYPTESFYNIYDKDMLNYVKKYCNFALVGHVHDKWSIKVCEGIININVGVDVRNYRPITDEEVALLYKKFIT